MNQQFEIIRLAQESFIRTLDSVSIEQINKVPQGFTNNMIWNFAHVIASLQMLCYFRPGLSLRLDETFVNKYKVGTRPEGFVPAEEYETIKQLAGKGLETLREDYRNGYFNQFKSYTTSTGLAVPDPDFAIRYTGFHHGLHQGYANALKKLVA
jgi:hypothetical protein